MRLPNGLKLGEETNNRRRARGAVANVPAIMEHAGRIGYDGWLVVEPDVPDPDGWLRYLAHARSYLQALPRG